MIRLAGAALALGLVAFAWAPAAWGAGVLGVLGVALALADYADLRATLRAMSVVRELPAIAGRGVTFTARLTVKNMGGRVLAGEIRDVLPEGAQPPVWIAPLSVAAQGEMEVTCPMRLDQRGLHSFGPVWVRLRGRLGMLEAQGRHECFGQIKILPESAASTEPLRKHTADEKILLDKLTRTRLRGEGMEFESLNEFRQGEEPRRIDWRASARHRRLIIRRYQLEQHRDLMIVLDCGRLMGADAGGASKLDRAVDSALMLGRAALEGGDRCGVGLFDDRLLGYLPPQSGSRALRTLTETLYDVRTDWREANFGLMFSALQVRQIKRALVVVISDIVDVETTERFRTALATLARRHVVLFVALQTALMGERAGTKIESTVDVARKAVVLRMLREREKAIHSLRRSGVHILDAEPRQLTTPLINHYLQLRQSSRL
jgi:uncharacterized protein (DUF58 family)